MIDWQLTAVNCFFLSSDKSAIKVDFSLDLIVLQNHLLLGINGSASAVCTLAKVFEVAMLIVLNLS